MATYTATKEGLNMPVFVEGQQLFIFRGMPHTGKTEKGKLIAAQKGNCVVLKRAHFRQMLGLKSFTKGDEGNVSELFNTALDVALKTGKSVVIPDTNFQNRHIKAWMQKAHEFNVPVTIIDLRHVPFEIIAREHLKVCKDEADFPRLLRTYKTRIPDHFKSQESLAYYHGLKRAIEFKNQMESNPLMFDIHPLTFEPPLHQPHIPGDENRTG